MSVDRNVDSVIDRLAQRADEGLSKYGVTTERDDLDFESWLHHLQDELLDGAVYIAKLRTETVPQSLQDAEHWKARAEAAEARRKRLEGVLAQADRALAVAIEIAAKAFEDARGAEHSGSPGEGQWEDLHQIEYAQKCARVALSDTAQQAKKMSAALQDPNDPAKCDHNWVVGAKFERCSRCNVARALPIADRFTGGLVVGDDDMAVSHALLHLKQAPDAADMRERAAKLVEEHYGYKSIAPQIRALPIDPETGGE